MHSCLTPHTYARVPPLPHLRVAALLHDDHVLAHGIADDRLRHEEAKVVDGLGVLQRQHVHDQPAARVAQRPPLRPCRSCGLGGDCSGSHAAVPESAGAIHTSNAAALHTPNTGAVHTPSAAAIRTPSAASIHTPSAGAVHTPDAGVVQRHTPTRQQARKRQHQHKEHPGWLPRWQGRRLQHVGACVPGTGAGRPACATLPRGRSFGRLLGVTCRSLHFSPSHHHIMPAASWAAACGRMLRGWCIVGAWLVHSWGMVGAWLGHGWGTVGA
eukprot:356872-Chlamydomonas_euryale.AAC.3